ncbi:MAG: TadE/TadG family type IV pilus assembly protein [Candidatus Rokuibacteriota bacterium]
MTPRRLVSIGRLWGQRGVSTLEFIVVLPFLLMVLFAIVEMSRAWLMLNLVTMAAREGARVAAVVSPDEVTAAGTARIDQILTPGTWTGTVTCADPCEPDSQVQATVAVTFATLVPLLAPMLGTFAIAQTATVRYE